ncbi:MAG: recombinase family protein [Chloroflexi bacterium]|nr:recombinase family protein [Chloroflexota bacterium]
MRALIYARVSTEEQAEKGTSTEAQLEQCRKYAAENSMEVVGEFVDDFTGTTLNRTQLNELQEVVDQGGADAVIALTADRLSRSYPDSVYLLSLWADRGIQVHFTDIGQEKSDFEGMLVGAIRRISAHNEIDTLVRRTSRGREDKVKINKKPVLGGIVAYGYRKDGLRHDAKFVIHEQEADVVKEIFRLYTQDRLSLRGVAKHLTNRKIPTPKNRSPIWGKTTVRKILINELYAGVYWWGKTRLEKRGFQQKGKLVKQPRDKWVHLDLPDIALVDRNTWEVAQQLIDTNMRLSKRNRKYDYLMSGFFRCGICGNSMRGSAQKRKNSLLFSYRCGKNWGTQKCPNRTKSIVTHKVDNAVWGWIYDLLSSPEELERGIHEIVANQQKEIPAKRNRLKAIDKHIAEHETIVSRLVQEMGRTSDQYLADTYRKEIENASSARGVQIAEREALSRELQREVFTQNDQDLIKSIAADINVGLENAGYDDKREILQVLGVQVVFHSNNGERRIEVSCPIPNKKDNITFTTS